MGTREGSGEGNGVGGSVGSGVGDREGKGVGAGVGSATWTSSKVDGRATRIHLEVVAVAARRRRLPEAAPSSFAAVLSSILEQQLLPTAAVYRGRTKRACARDARCTLKLLPSLVSNSSARAFRTCKEQLKSESGSEKERMHYKIEMQNKFNIAQNQSRQKKATLYHTIPSLNLTA